MQKIVFIDWDGTLVSSNSIQYLLFVRQHLWKSEQGIDNLFYYVGAWLATPLIVLFHFLGKESWRDQVLCFFYRGATKSQLELSTQKFWERSRHSFNNQVWKSIADHKKKGDCKLVIVSASVREVIESGLKAWGKTKEIDSILCTELAFQENGTCTGGLSSKVVIDRQKLVIAKKYVEESGRQWEEVDTCMYYDSSSDQFLAIKCKKAVVINPNTQLQKSALDFGHETLKSHPDLPLTAEIKHRIASTVFFFTQFGLKSLPESEIPQKCMVVTGTYTSQWDLFYTIMYFWYFNLNLKIGIKSKLFDNWLLAEIFQALGGYPLDREEHADQESSWFQIFSASDQLRLTIASPIQNSLKSLWKMGFYQIAKDANVPLALSIVDYEERIIGIGKIYSLSGNLEQDYQTFQSFYGQPTVKSPIAIAPLTIVKSDNTSPSTETIKKAAGEHSKKSDKIKAA